jgi:acetyltransferase-like isoleucine patch superfamily enzyme
MILKLKILIVRFVKSPLRAYVSLRKLYFLTIRPLFSRSLAVVSGARCIVTQDTYFTGNGSISIGDRVVLGYKDGGYFRGNCLEFVVRDGGRIVVGSNTHFNNNCCLSAKQLITIGSDCLIGHNCEFSDTDGHEIDPETRTNSSGITEAVTIGNNVWLGNGCKILRGSRIGRNCIVAAGAVVKGVFADNCILGGVPAKVIRTIDVID